MMGNGKLPSSPLFKMVMIGFGKYLKPYLKCPIKTKQLKFERIIPDPKFLMFVPSRKYCSHLLLEGETADKQKDHINITFTAIISDN